MSAVSSSEKIVLESEKDIVSPMQLGVINSNPIQYFAPLYRRLNEEPDLEVTAFYCSRRGVESYSDSGFGDISIKWDRPLLEGYNSVFLPNISDDKKRDGFWSLVNPSIISELRDRDLDALWLHGHNYCTYMIAFVAARILGIPLMMRAETHSLLQRPWLKELIRGPLLTAFYSQFGACLPIGTKNAEFYLDHGIEPGRLFVVPYTVDNEYFAERALQTEKDVTEFRQKQGLDPDRPVILYASKMIRRKRALDLLIAFERLQQRGQSAQLVYVGDGEDRSELENYSVRHRVSDVHFMGFRNQSELPSWYSMADMFVLPSENEPWGLIINEVMNAGIPVISTTDVGAVYDLVIDGETGLVYEPGDTDALATALETLVSDNDLRKKMGKAAKQKISTWSYEEAVDGIRAAMNYLCEKQ